MPPFGDLVYLYVGTADFERDLAYYRDTLGAPVVWVSATVWLFVRGATGWGVFMALWGFFGISGIDNFLRPYLISRGAQLPFVLVFLGAMGGIIAFGLIGLFLGPILLAVGYCLAQEFFRHKRAPGGGPQAV